MARSLCAAFRYGGREQLYGSRAVIDAGIVARSPGRGIPESTGSTVLGYSLGRQTRASVAADSPSAAPSDVWSEWLLHRRHGGDPAFAHVVRTDVERYADRVLDHAQLTAGMTLVDIGAGEGLIAFRAIERIGPSLRVLLTDISAALLHHAEALAVERGVRAQCTFLCCPADQLTEIPDASVDVVATRAVLAYVADKPAALREFHRILKPGARISLAEPILQDDALMASALRSMIEARGTLSHDRFLPLLHRWKAAQYPDTPERIAKSPIANYSERNLFDFVRTAVSPRSIGASSGLVPTRPSGHGTCF